MRSLALTWIAAFVGLGLASYGAVTIGHGAPIVWLATTLPLVLAATLRPNRVFAPWLIAAVATAVALWWTAAVGGAPPYFVFAVATLGVLAFLAEARHDLRTAAWLLVLGAMIGTVAYVSSNKGGPEPMLAWLMSHGLTAEQAHAATLAIRKTIHFTAYGSVGWVAFRADEAAGARLGYAIATGLGTAASLAIFDELRQAGYSNRTGSAWDVLLDLSGATVFLGISGWLRGRRAVQ